MSAIKQITSKEEFNTLINGDEPVLVDFFATWCGPCQMTDPMLEEMANSYKNIDKVEIAKVDVDQSKDIASEYNVMSMPTFIIFNNGKVEETYVGMRPTEEFETKLDQLIKH